MKCKCLSLASWLPLSVASVFGHSEDARAVVVKSNSVSPLRELQILDQRVADIGWRLATKNLDICPKRTAATGITLHSASQYSGDWRIAASQEFSFGAGNVSVLAVAVGSPAWEAGIRTDDTILTLNGESLHAVISDDTDNATYAETDNVMKKLESAPAGKSLVLETLRGQTQSIVSFVPVPACASRFEMAPSNEFNANANGAVVQVDGKLVLALSDDNDLALVLAHELAHNILEHSQMIRRSHLSTGLASIWTGSGKTLREFERHADRYGIFMSARAGYEYKNAATFWRRLASIGGIRSWIALTHPNPMNRERNAQVAVDDVTALTESGKPLIP